MFYSNNLHPLLFPFAFYFLLLLVVCVDVGEQLVGVYDMSVVLVEASPQALGLCLGQIVLSKVGETPLRTT